MWKVLILNTRKPEPKKKKKQINTSAKGRQFEYRSDTEVKKLVDCVVPNNMVYTMRAAASRGIADRDYWITNTDNGKAVFFGLQCKAGYCSPNSMKDSISYALKEYNLELFFSFLDKKEFRFNPNLKGFLEEKLL